MLATRSRGRARAAVAGSVAPALAAALLLAACGSARRAVQTQSAPRPGAQQLSLNASCAQWELASAAERRAFTEGLFRAPAGATARARGDLPPSELRLLIALHCGGGNAAGTPLGLVVINAIVGTLGSGSGRGG
jgi:hypothetical protein